MKYSLIVVLFLVSPFCISAKIIDHLFPNPKEIIVHHNTLNCSMGYLTNNSSELSLNYALKEKLAEIGVNLNLDVINSNSKSPLVQILIDTLKLHPQHYTIDISSAMISIKGGNESAIYYAFKTLSQIINYAKSAKSNLPCLEIKDWPDFERRGYMLDISRDKVPTMKTLYHLIDLLEKYKINEFQLYTEHTFAYKNHSTVWKDASPMTPDEIRRLDKYCKERHIDLVPNQNSFGHMEKWLEHDEYLHLAEAPEPVKTIWGTRSRHSLNPIDSGSLALMEELYTELCPNFTSKYLNIGCDETVELGEGKSKQECERIGKGQVYLNYLKNLNSASNKNGKLAQFWGDIILNHPELISQIPSNMTAMVWGYEGDFPFDKNLPKFKDAGLDFYVCPGTSTWRSLIGRNKNAFENLKNAAINGYKNQAKGYLNTNWGDYGHWQPLSVCYPAMLYGAAVAWNSQTNPEKQLSDIMSSEVFMDTTGIVSKVLLTLGNAYLNNKLPNGNANAYHMFLRRYMWTLKGHHQLKHATIEGLEQSIDCIQRTLSQLNSAHLQCPDADIVISEIYQAAHLAIHGCHLGIARLKVKDNSISGIPISTKKKLKDELIPLIENHKKLWLVRNRPGGLLDSTDKLNGLLEAYR